VNRIIRDLGGATPLGRAFGIAVVIVVLFLLAWLVSRAAARMAAFSIDRSDRRRQGDATPLDTGGMTSLRQRTTAISLVQTSVRYLAFAFALVLSVVALSGAQRLQTIVGASFLAVLIGFAAQRFLTDVVAGLLMFFEGWFRIGDTVQIDPWNVRGVVEGVSLRSLTIRSVTGEIVHVPNSQVIALRVVPRGYREVEVEFFTSELEPARELVDEVARIVPADPTRFVRRPRVVETDQLDDQLFRITVTCAVAVGREWLAEDFLPTLIRERAASGLLVHGPIVTFTDPQATRSFARALMADGGRERGDATSLAWPGQARFAPPTEEDGRA
jgi:moderate conductance mechanosensitive channel